MNHRPPSPKDIENKDDRCKLSFINASSSPQIQNGGSKVGVHSRYLAPLTPPQNRFSGSFLVAGPSYHGSNPAHISSVDSFAPTGVNTSEYASLNSPKLAAAYGGPIWQLSPANSNYMIPVRKRAQTMLNYNQAEIKDDSSSSDLNAADDESEVEMSGRVKRKAHKPSSLNKKRKMSAPPGMQYHVRLSGDSPEAFCEACGKKYKNQICLQKHQWEHHDSWDFAKRLASNKHQSVQLLEAAQALININAGVKPRIPQDGSTRRSRRSSSITAGR